MKQKTKPHNQYELEENEENKLLEQEHNYEHCMIISLTQTHFHLLINQ